VQQVTSKDGTTIAFDRTGDGSPVIIVGGAFSQRKYPYLVQLAGLLAERFAIINYDRRGRGDSGDTRPYAIEREVEDLGALIDEVGGSASVFGLSSGANLALQAAADGLAIVRLALWEPPFALVGESPLPPDALVERYGEMVAAGRRGEVVEHFMEKVVGLPPEVVAQARKSPFWHEQEALAHTLVYDTILLGDGSLPVERAAAVKASTLVLEGGESFPFMRGSAWALADFIQDAQWCVLEGQTHEVAPEVIAPVLEEFFVGGSRRRESGNDRED
jgi:pimeloyl-ACP methyl ester carboxylesterase